MKIRCGGSEKRARARTSDGQCGRFRPSFGDQATHDDGETQYAVQPNLDQVLPRKVWAPQESPELLHFTVRDGEQGTMDHRERRHSREDVERVQVEPIRKDVGRQERLRGEKEGREDDEEGTEREPFFVERGERDAE